MACIGQFLPSSDEVSNGKQNQESNGDWVMQVKTLLEPWEGILLRFAELHQGDTLKPER